MSGGWPRRGRKPYAAHAADGTFLGRFPDRDSAIAALRLSDLEPMGDH